MFSEASFEFQQTLDQIFSLTLILTWYLFYLLLKHFFGHKYKFWTGNTLRAVLASSHNSTVNRERISCNRSILMVVPEKNSTYRCVLQLNLVHQRHNSIDSSVWKNAKVDVSEDVAAKQADCRRACSGTAGSADAAPITWQSSHCQTPTRPSLIRGKSGLLLPGTEQPPSETHTDRCGHLQVFPAAGMQLRSPLLFPFGRLWQWSSAVFSWHQHLAKSRYGV